ncbi:hypothetical protein LTR85_009135 [Meristemomyces frigidus]|nr:hypothetical protein LTR85_009135 [Meristemomyces frigidus]
MNPPISPAQRQRVAQHWRASPEAQQMPPQQVEQFAQQILSGAADNHVVNYLPQLQAQQAQTPSASPALNFQSLFGNSMQMPMFQQMQPTQFSAMPHMPLMAPPHFPGMPLMPMAPLGVPQMSQQTTQFPGGLANHQSLNLTGTSGNATFSYSSSSTSGSWSDNGAHSVAQQSLPVPQGYPRTIAIEGPTPGFVQPLPLTPMQLPQPFTQYASSPPATVSPPARPSGYQSPPPSYREAPLYLPTNTTDPQPQNPRLHSAFTQQASEDHHDTYFSMPPGAPDQAAPPPQQAPQRQRQRHPECGPTCPRCDGDSGAIHDWERELGDEILGRNGF